MEKNTRKPIRLVNYNYSSNGLYFITFCTKDRIHYLSEIIYDDQFDGVMDEIAGNTEFVGNVALGVPCVKLTGYGVIVNENIKKPMKYTDMFLL